MSMINRAAIPTTIFFLLTLGITTTASPFPPLPGAAAALQRSHIGVIASLVEAVPALHKFLPIPTVWRPTVWRFIESLAEAVARDRAFERISAALQATLGYGMGTEFEELRRIRAPVRGQVEYEYGTRRGSSSRHSVRHTGLTYHVSAGAAVRSVARGIVSYANEFNGYGRVVILDHGSGYNTVYGYLGSLQVEEGEAVDQSQQLGNTEVYGPCEGRCLYFEIRHNGDPLDPDDWLD